MIDTNLYWAGDMWAEPRWPPEVPMGGFSYLSFLAHEEAGPYRTTASRRKMIELPVKGRKHPSF